MNDKRDETKCYLYKMYWNKLCKNNLKQNFDKHILKKIVLVNFFFNWLRTDNI